MDENKQTKKVFDYIDGNALMTLEFEPLGFAVDRILPHGLFIMAGSGKIGKSWLALDICASVAMGGKLWDFPCEHGDVMYLSLEDNYRRLQDRLDKIKATGTDISRLKLCCASFGINSGLIEQVHNFVAEHPATKLIVIDTLERIRDTELDKSIYSCDYRDMTTLRGITDKHDLTLLLVHHTRKMYDPDPLNTLSGSTGLVGSVDGVLVLQKEKRMSSNAKLTIANRDTEGFCFRLELDTETCKWNFLGNDVEVEEEQRDNFCALINGFLKETWSGTATELSESLNELDPEFGITKLNIKRKLESKSTALKEDFGITVDIGRDSSVRRITLERRS